MEEKIEVGVLPFNSLLSFAVDYKKKLPGFGSNAFISTSEEERETFFAIIKLILNEKEIEKEWFEKTIDLRHLSSINYKVFQLFDEVYNQRYFVLLENNEGTFKAQGAYIFAAEYSRNVLLEVPHPIYDLQTLEESVSILQNINAKAIFISGSHRCANNDEASPCSGMSKVLSESLRAFRISDVAHYPFNFFHTAHKASLFVNDPIIAISVHGNKNQSVPDILLSDGTTFISDDSSLVNRLCKSLVDRGVSVDSVNSIIRKCENYPLVGELNIQGRLSNRSPNPCLVSASLSSGLFIHLEQHLNIRTECSQLISSLIETIPIL